MGMGRLARWVVGQAGLRFLGRRKAALSMAVATLALALGANTLVMSAVKAVLFASFALPEPGRTFIIAPVRELPGRGEVVFAEAYPNYLLIRETQRSFVDVSVSLQNVSSWDDGVETRPLHASRVSASFFSTLGVHPALGRAFETSEEGPSPAPVVIVGHELWRGALGADPRAVGRTMVLNGEPHTVIGVMPEGFTHPLPTEIWLPFDTPETARTAITGGRNLGVHARLGAGVDVAAAEAEMETLTRRAVEASTDNADYRYELRTIAQVTLPGADRTLLLVQLGAALLTLLAVVNLSALLVAWGYERRQEMSVRISLGASGARVGGLLVAQGVAVVAAGAAGGLLVAAGTVPVLRRLPLGSAASLYLRGVTLDGPVLAASAAAALVAGLAAGLVPAVLTRSASLGDALRSGRGTSVSPGGLRWQKGMVATQVVLTVLILSGAARVGLSFRNLMRVPDGFVPAGKLVARVQLPGVAYQEHPARADFGRRLLDALAAESALDGAAFTSTLPVSDQRWGGRFFPELPDGTLAEDPVLLHFRRISPGYLAMMGIPVAQGRAIDERDDGTQPRVAAVSRAAAALLWPGQEPVGQVLYRVLAGGAPPEALDVVGVVGDVMDGGYGAPPGEAVYVPFEQVSLGRMSIVVRPRADAARAVAAVRSALRRADPDVAATDIAELDALVAEANALSRLQATLLAFFALVAALVAGMGIFGLMTQLVAAREREFALRLAVGASQGRVGASVLVQAARIGGPGVAAGVALALLLASGLRPFLFGVDPRSAPVTAAVAAGTLLVVGLASLPAAVRAMRVHVASSLTRG